MGEWIQAALRAVLVIIYGISILYLTIYGLNTLGLTILYYINRRRKPRSEHAVYQPAYWPKVTIQLPIYNEKFMVDQLIQSVTKLDYPRGCLQIQVLDDSTDETTDIVRKLVARYQARGYQIELLHRIDREGYKAGALANGLKTAQGEFVAIFDADFRPGEDWLKQVIVEFDRPEIACLQTRWGHLNASDNILTKVQTLALDGHFMIEQGARYTSNLLMGFNGSAGIWRKASIVDAGGWEWDTLTEDLDLSYRAQIRGWRVKFSPEIIVPAVLPARMDAFKVQQYRWAKGSVQTLRKLGWRVLTSRLPLNQRISGLIHMAMYIPYPFTIMTLLLTLPMVLWAPTFMPYFSWTVLASPGPPLLYATARTKYLPHLRDRLLRLPLLMVVAIGISLNTSLAVMAGLSSHGGVFDRTPKYDMKSGKKQATDEKYRLRLSPVVWGEVILGLYALTSLVILWPTPSGKALITFYLLYAAGFLFVALMSFIQNKEPEKTAVGQLQPLPIPTTGSPGRVKDNSQKPRKIR